MKRGKQHDARGASFRRIARSIRKEVRKLGLPRNCTAYRIPTFIAAALENEAKLLRKMR